MRSKEAMPVETAKAKHMQTCILETNEEAQVGILSLGKSSSNHDCSSFIFIFKSVTFWMP